MNLTGAESLGLGPGDSLVSSPETMFDIAGVYPLKMKVVGLGVFDNFDSRPPTEGDSVKNDLGIETMISWKFK